MTKEVAEEIEKPTDEAVEAEAFDRNQFSCVSEYSQLNMPKEVADETDKPTDEAVAVVAEALDQSQAADVSKYSQLHATKEVGEEENLTYDKSITLHGTISSSILTHSSEYFSEISLVTPGSANNTIKRRLPRSSYSETETAVDVESQLACSHRHRDGKSSPRKSQAHRASSTSKYISFPTRVLLRKIATAVLTNLDNETLQREDTETILILITLIKDVIFGIIIAFVLASSFLCLDHLFGLHLRMAHNTRRTMFALMNDQEMLHTFEENTGWQFMLLKEYTPIVREIEDAVNERKRAEILLKTRSEELVDLKKELDMSKFHALFASLDLDKFCEQCIWHKQTSCIQRVEALRETHGTPKFRALLSAMEMKSCWKSTEQVEKEKKQKELVETLLKDWAEKGKYFCRNCSWDDNMSCYTRASYLRYVYGTPLGMAMAQVMVEAKECDTSSIREEDKKLSSFCDECEWGNKSTCSQRVEYLIHRYKVPEHKAKLSAMERLACVLSGEGA